MAGAAIRLDGGRGSDRLLATGDLDLRDVPDDKLVDIEAIDIETNLILTKADVLAISSTTDTLKVLGERGDSVDIVGKFKDLGVSGRFHHYKIGAGTLLVETDVIVS